MAELLGPRSVPYSEFRTFLEAQALQLFLASYSVYLTPFWLDREPVLDWRYSRLMGLMRENESKNHSSSLEPRTMRLLSSEKGFYLTLEGHEKEENDTFHEPNKIPSLLRGGTSAPSPAPAPAGGCSCTLTMSPSGALSREPRPPPPSPARSPPVASSAPKPLLRPRSLTSGSPAHSGLALMIDSHVTQWPEEKALKPAPYLLSTNSVTLSFSSSV